MIERSRRSVSTKPTLDALRLHERLASQRLWFFRLLVASGLALVLSVVLWLVRVPLVWHLLGIALGFLAGLFVQRPTTAWALEWIRARAGLSYETALEQSQDDYGFAGSLKERATEEASRLTLPKYQAWWLPMLALALGLAFLPLVPSLIELPAPLASSPTTSPLPEVSNQPANTVEPAQPQTTSQTVAEPPPGSQAGSQDTNETDTSQLSDAIGSSPSASSNQSADEQALDQFLENLRQNETAEEGAPDVDLSSVMQPGGSSGGASDEDRASRPRSEQTNPFSQGAEPPNAAQQGQSETSQGQQDSQTSEGQDGGEQSTAQAEQGQEQSQENAEGSEQGAAEDSAGEQSAGEQNASEQGTGEQSAQQGEGQQGEGQQAENEQSQAGSGENGASAAAQGDEQGSDSGQNASGAGNLPGTPTGQATKVTGDSQQNPDFLPGQLSEGTTNIAGTARLPGEANETVFPDGSVPGSFSRAEEEALTEGRIPLEYQEVIRNYFGRGAE